MFPIKPFHNSFPSSWFYHTSTVQPRQHCGKQSNLHLAFSKPDDLYYSFSPAFNPLSANPTKWSNILKQFVDKLPMNCLGVFDHFVGLALKITGIYTPKNFIHGLAHKLQTHMYISRKLKKKTFCEPRFMTSLYFSTKIFLKT